MQTITIEHLTIRQLKVLGKANEVKGFSKMASTGLRAGIALAVGDEKVLQQQIDAMLSPEDRRKANERRNGRTSGQADGKSNGKAHVSKLTADEKSQQQLDALVHIGKASGRRMKAEDSLRSRRGELNQEVSESKASHKGSMEREVDYEDHGSVSSKLQSVTEAWQSWHDSLEHRRLELEPLKERLKTARANERKAFEESTQLRIRF